MGSITKLHHYECCTSRPWSKFSRLKIWYTNISDIVKANAEMLMSFIDFDICNRMAQLRMLCSITLTSFLRLKIYLLCIGNKTCAMTMHVPGRFVTCMASAMGLLLSIYQFIIILNIAFHFSNLLNLKIKCVTYNSNLLKINKTYNQWNFLKNSWIV